MLHFLQHAPSYDHNKSIIRYRPERTNGNSFQSPTTFQNKYTILNDQSYLNPFLKYQNNLGCLSAERHTKSFDPKWTKKINLSNLQTSKIELGNTPKLKPLRQAANHQDRYHQEIAINPLRFRLVKGQFTEYLNKNIRYQSIGPLQGTQRGIDRVQKTKTTMKKRRQQKIEGLTNSNKYKSQLYQTIKSNLIQNSSLLTYKNRIKCNRDVINRHFKNDIQRRHKKSNYSFLLPNSQCQLNNLAPDNRRYKTQSSYK